MTHRKLLTEKQQAIEAAFLVSDMAAQGEIVNLRTRTIVDLKLVHGSTEYYSCYKCSQWKLLTDFEGGRRPNRRQGRMLYCKICRNKQRVANGAKEKSFNWHLGGKYGWTRALYETTRYELQNNKCKICERELSANRKKTAVDHCHRTGVVRGILCINCNQGLGNFADKTHVLRRAIEYVEKEGKI